MLYFKKAQMPLGDIMLVSEDGQSLSGLYFAGQKTIPELKGIEMMCEVFDRTEEWLRRYFAGENPPAKNIPLQMNGTAFQRRIWEELLKIPYGETVTYSRIASAAGCRSAQAVGQAIGKNPIAILVPCHRVIGKNGSLTGYAGGTDIKWELLKLEGKF